MNFKKMKFEKWRILYRLSNHQRESSGYSTNAKLRNSLGWIKNNQRYQNTGLMKSKGRSIKNTSGTQRGKRIKRTEKNLIDIWGIINGINFGKLEYQKERGMNERNSI